jgi:hypothetical protein
VGVRINITKSDDDVRIRAALMTMNGTFVEGLGHVQRNPRDRLVPEVGDEPAASRALIDLGGRLIQLPAAESAPG